MAIPKTDPRGVRIQPDVRSEVQEFFDVLARGLTAGDGDAVAEMYEVPALIISDDGVHAINSSAEIAQVFGSAQATRPDLIDLERIGKKILVATVRWPHLDASRKEVASESSDYTLRRDDSGQLRIRSVLMRGMAAQPKR